MRYTTGVPIGSGGMGTVVKSFDPVLQRHVAIKILRRDEPELAERLLREARAQAAVDHPNVAKVYEVGHLEDGRPFIAMQLIEGKPLDQAVSGLSLEQKVRLLATVAEAVQAAHATGLVHRDLKPSNILVETGDGELRPYVVDFGIAREEAVAGLTVTGQIVGTPGYMAPEQAAGVVHQLDRRADIFSLGVILFEMVSGSQPFRGDSAIEKLVSLLQDEPASLRSRLRHAPPDLDAIVAHCLEKSPTSRYPSARALAEDLHRFLAGEPVVARRVSWLGRTLRATRKHPAVATLLATAAALVLVTATLATRASFGARRQAQLAHELGQRIERIDAVMRIAHLSPLHDISAERQQIRDELAGITASLRGLSEREQAVAHYALGRGHLSLQAWDTARRELEQAWDAGWQTGDCAVALARSHAELYRERLARARRQRDEDARQAGLARAAAEHRDPARRYLAAARGTDPAMVRLVDGLLLLADRDPEAALAQASRLAGAPRVSAEIAAEAARLAGEASLQKALELRWKSDAAGQAHAIEQARASFTHATTILRSDPMSLLGTCRTWASSVELQADTGTSPGEAMAAVERTCDVVLRVDPTLTEAHLVIGAASCAVAQFSERRGLDPAAALSRVTEATRAALRIDAASYDALMLEATALHIRADRLHQQPAASMQALREASDLLATAQRIDPLRPEAFHAQGNNLFTQAMGQQAIGQDPAPALQAAVRALEQALALPEGATRRTYNTLGLTYSELAHEAKLRGRDGAGDLAKGIVALEQAIAVSPSYVTGHNSLGVAYWTLGELEAVAGRDPGPAVLKARAAFTRMLELDPSRMTAHINLASVLAFQARWQLNHMQDPTATLSLAWTHARALQSAFPWESASAGVELCLIAAEWARANHAPTEVAIAAAAGHAETAVRLEPEDAESHYAMAAVARLRVTQLQSAARPDPHHVAREVARGLGHVARALAINPRHTRALACKAVLLQAQSSVTTEASERQRLGDEARACARATFEIEPTLDDPELRGLEP